MAKFKVAMVDYDYDSLAPIQAEVEKLGGAFVHRRCKDVAEAISWAGDANGWIIQYLSPIGEEVFKSCANLKAVGRTGIGYDVIDVPAATRHNIVVTNVPSYCEDEVSDHAMALMLSCARRTALYTAAVKGGKWDWKLGQPIMRLRGQTLGLAGFGKIPRALSPKAKAFGMTVLAHDPYLKPEQAKKEGVELVDFDTLLRRSDFISVHCPLNAETKGLFGKEAFGKMKRTAFLINTARGGIVDLPALTEALKSGRIGGAGLDVLPQEPPAAGEALLKLDNVVLTPHVGWYSEQSIVDLQAAITRNVCMVCSGKKPAAVLNPDVLGKVKLA
jgi:D-3-phosphoglycerate dehydrogenase / 2-oxoglutarate reductase